MSENEEVRQSVSDFYARKVESGESCCGGPVRKGVAAKLAGYSSAELEALPPDAVVNSFGCGNPLAFSEVREGEVVLDLGSGAGIDILLAGKKVGPAGKAIGIDMTDEMIARARENIAASGLANVEVRKGIIEDLPVESNSVDWVISNCVINLSPEKARVFAEIFRVLKPGGRMLVSDIMAKDLPSWVRESQTLHSACVSGAVDEESYLEGLKHAGLTDVAVRERLHYETPQIRSLIESEVPQSCCGPTLATERILTEVAKDLDGKVWSAKIFARKPVKG